MRRIIWLNITDNIETIPPSIHSKDHRFFIFLNYMFLFSCIGHIIFMPVFYFLGNSTVYIINGIAITIDIIAIGLNRRGYINLASIVWILVISIHSFYSIIAFGWNHGYQYYFLTLVIVVFFARWPIFLRGVITIILCVAELYMFRYTEIHIPKTESSESTIYIMHIFNVITNFFALAYASLYYRKYSEQMEQRLYHLANTDVLTGISNRRAFEQCARRVIENLANSKKQYALLLIDIDYFKKINDTFGHAAGDAVLQQFGRVFKESLRQSDIFGRVGGEEFAVLLTKVNHTEAVHIAERLRTTIEMQDFIVEGAGEIHVTVSIGLTMRKEHHNESLSTVMVRSDKALYQAKHEGRNRTVAYV